MLNQLHQPHDFCKFKMSDVKMRNDGEEPGGDNLTEQGGEVGSNGRHACLQVSPELLLTFAQAQELLRKVL